MRHGPSGMARLIGTGLVLIASGAIMVGDAQAYVRTLSEKTKKPLSWSTTRPAFEVLLGSRPPDVSEELFKRAVSEAAAQWSASPTLPCTEMSISTRSSLSSKEYVQADGVNRVQFRSDAWGRYSPNPDHATAHPPNALAITSIFASATTGEISDIDIDINAVSFRWADLVANPELAARSDVHDLQNTLTHEFGHVIGLDHTCDGGAQSNHFNHEGKPVPACPGPAEIQQTTMAAIVTAGDTVRRSLSPDDQAGVCALYPLGGGGGDDGGGCSISRQRRSAGGQSWFSLAALASAAVLWARRKRCRQDRLPHNG